MPKTADSLPRSAFLVLLALVDQPRHGLGVVEEVEHATVGRVKLGPGTLYGTLQKLVEMGLAKETRDVPDPSDHDPRRRYYRITPKGERALRADATRMQALVHAAVTKRVLEEG